jgi:hypothetical protein
LQTWYWNSSRASSSSRAAASRRSICSGESEPRAVSRSTSDSNDGGSMKIPVVAHLAGALNVDLEHDSARRALQLAAQRAVAVAGIDRVLDELPGGHAAIEVLLAEEVVVDPIHLAWARVAGGGRDGQL